ncbi:MAG: cell division protein FtsW [Alphaproteobacteria bacterium BRH_c36]|nr:MAG: cell division protein FtsW [Alphaproteobacteria bacterium BRH_c36]
MRVTRADRSRVAEWWFTVDHVLIVSIMTLMLSGLVLSLAASPAIALKKGLPTFYFFERHVAFSAAGFATMIAMSFLTPSLARRFAAMLLAGTLTALIWVLFDGPLINGSRRWLDLGAASLQPSEFVKPAFVMIIAWLFAEARRRPDMPALPIAIALGALVCGLLVLQPDVGQTILVAVMWGVMYLLAGLPLAGAALLGGVGLVGLIVAYFVFPHVHDRIDRFISASQELNSQAARAFESFAQGGFFGRGPGEGTIKTRFPDAHTDYIYAVLAEEYGAVACLALAGLFGFIVVKALVSALSEPRPANRIAIQGLIVMFGLQALVNMGVNVGLLPATGMTLPFISAGGSSILAISVTLGMVLALTRRRADSASFERPDFAPAMTRSQDETAMGRRG